MIQTIYYIILIYFLLGGIGFYIINRKKDSRVALKSYTKFGVYFIIINFLFFSIVINPLVFQYLSILIIGVGFFEMFRLFQKSGYRNNWFYLLSLLVYGTFSTGFLLFGNLQKELILYSFIVLSIFDSFSQITGQLFGSKKLFPKTSPNKTLGGLIGGGLIAITSSFFLSNLFTEPDLKTTAISLGVVFFAFTGDLAASFYKRKFNVKDYSNLIPGHGGFLDRFDSLIVAGAWVAFNQYVLNI
ncbi:phosphatidate cytidylyltransferase [Roseimarinus sediminis]|uniref:phosphatidate cytidylyltransferase n=1 Tax=Roseimarinus sediminis TaxID=1610899 RepID=UPI003D25403C